MTFWSFKYLLPFRSQRVIWQNHQCRVKIPRWSYPQSLLAISLYKNCLHHVASLPAILLTYTNLDIRLIHLQELYESVDVRVDDQLYKSSIAIQQIDERSTVDNASNHNDVPKSIDNKLPIKGRK